MGTFNLKKIAIRTPLPEGTPHKIKDRGIKWEERYHDKSEPLKKRLDKLIGQGSYYRWEGHDNYTDSDYFVVVGPAITKEGHKKWFAGNKKLPKDPEKKQFAPTGEYFTNIMSALSHASEKWGVPMPKGQPPYDENTLRNIKIPRHIKGHSDKLIKIAAYLSSQDRQNINNDLINNGFDGNGRFRSPTEAWQKIWSVLSKYNINPSEESSGDFTKLDQGRKTYPLFISTSEASQFDPGENIENSLLVFTWYKFEDDKFEVLSYLS